MIEMIALDIDGTLLTPGVPFDAMPQRDMTDAVKQLTRAGVTVVLASGRMYPGTAAIARHLQISQPLICQQGASVHEIDGQLRHGHAIDEDIALELIDYAGSNDWSLAWFDSQRYLVTRPSDAARFFAEVSMIEMEIHAQPHRSGVRATGIDIISTRDHARDVYDELSARYGDRLCLLDFPSVTAMHAPAASKGNALQALADELGIDRAHILAIGDSVNDVSMLQWAGQSAAPAHCDQYARGAAHEILEGDGVSGVVAKLREVLQQISRPRAD